MEEKKIEDNAVSLMAIPLFCPRDGSILEDGVRFGYAAWVCPMCTYWKIKPSGS